MKKEKVDEKKEMVDGKKETVDGKKEKVDGKKEKVDEKQQQQQQEPPKSTFFCDFSFQMLISFRTVESPTLMLEQTDGHDSDSDFEPLPDHKRKGTLPRGGFPRYEKNFLCLDFLFYF